MSHLLPGAKLTHLGKFIPCEHFQKVTLIRMLTLALACTMQQIFDTFYWV